MVALAIVIFAATALLAVGCGGGDDGSERAVEWSVDRDRNTVGNGKSVSGTV